MGAGQLFPAAPHSVPFSHLPSCPTHSVPTMLPSSHLQVWHPTHRGLVLNTRIQILAQT